VSVSLPVELYNEILEKAKAEGKSVSAVIRELLQAKLSGNPGTYNRNYYKNYKVEFSPAYKYNIPKEEIEETEKRKKEEAKKQEKEYNKLMNNLMRAKDYLSKIIEKKGYVTRDDLDYVIDKYKVPEEVILNEMDLVMKEPDKFYPA